MLKRFLGKIPALRLRTFLKLQPLPQPCFRFFAIQNLKEMKAIQTLKELGYGFNTEGKLRKLNENGEPGGESFQFMISDKHHECQAHYEKIGDAVTEYIYHLLETEGKLESLRVPKEGDPEKSTFIFASKDYDKKDTLLVLIHGSGVVRAGQWARSLIINENIEMGSQLPYIKKAHEKGYGILVMNTNDNYTEKDEEIDCSANPEMHATYVWETYVANASATNILIVAHSYGGVVTLSLANRVKEDFEKRVKAIALTDSVHGFVSNGLTDYLRDVSRNWVASSEPLDSIVLTPCKDIERVSAGHTKHEMTSYSCMDSVFKFFEEKIQNQVN